MKLLLLSAIIFFITYLIISTKKYLIKKKTLPTSISITYYYVPTWLFVSFLLYSCGTISIINLMIKPTDTFILSNLGGWLLVGVGFMSDIKNKIVLKFHMFGALLGFALILIGFWFDYSMSYITTSSAIMILLTGIIFRNKDFKIWAIEIVAIISMLIGYGILIFS